MEPPKQIIVISAGVFGLSATWHLSTDTGTKVTVFDHPYPEAPTRDTSKILRIDYASPERILECKRSKECWKTDPVFMRFYKETGRLVSYPPASLQTLLDIDIARSQIGLPRRERGLDQKFHKMFGPALSSSDHIVVHNEDDAVVHWSGAIQSLRSDCIRKGAILREDLVTRLQVGVNGRIVRIVTSSGSIDARDAMIILSAGPWITQILNASQIQQPPDSRAPVATGIFSFSLHLNDKDWEKYCRLPIVSQIGVGEFMCHPTQNCSAKLTWVRPFLNPSPDTGLSNPQDLSKSNLAFECQQQACAWLRQIVPELKRFSVISVRSWWDGVTQNQQPLIARHPDHPNLVIAGGGSYTHAKDLPTLGSVIRDVVNDEHAHGSYGWTLPPALEQATSNQPALRSNVNFLDLEIEASNNTQVHYDN